MIDRLKRFLLGGVLVGTLASSALAVTTPTTASALCSERFLSLPAWYCGLTDGDKIKNPRDMGGLGPFATKIALNVVEDLFQIVGYVAIGFIIYGGFMYLTSAGDPAKATGARHTIINAVVGLIISFFAAAIVALIGNNIGG